MEKHKPAQQDFHEATRRNTLSQSKKAFLKLMFTLVAFALLGVLLLAGCQRQLIYHPHGYPPEFRHALPRGTVELPFKTKAGSQVAFYIPANGDASHAPERLWVCCHGNAATALHWLTTIQLIRTSGVGFLLVDYPGYGASTGYPTRSSIAESSEGAYQALARHYQTSTADMDKRLNILAFSIGTGVALDFAVKHPPQRIVLLAPFTSLLDMAKRTVGTPLCYVLRDRFDNAARLSELAAQTSSSRVQLYHGQEDGVVPFSMGQSLAQKFPKMITFHPVAGAGHNDLLQRIEQNLATVLSTLD